MHNECVKNRNVTRLDVHGTRDVSPPNKKKAWMDCLRSDVTDPRDRQYLMDALFSQTKFELPKLDGKTPVIIAAIRGYSEVLSWMIGIDE